MNRFQRFLVFWKAKNLLFHLETTVLRDVVSFGEKNNIKYKNIKLIWKKASLFKWEFRSLSQYEHQNQENNTYITLFPCGTRNDYPQLAPHQFSKRSLQ